MKKSIVLFSIVLVLLTTASCVNSQNVITGKGELVTQNRSITGFNSISLDIAGDLYLTQGNFNCTVSAQQNIEDILITEVNGNELVIKFKDHMSVRESRDIKITLSLPDLKGLEINGSGNAYARSDFSSDKMKLDINGSGNIKMMNVSAAAFETEVDGSGTLEMKGLASDHLDAAVNGSGTISRLSGNVKNAKLQVNGSGEIEAADVSGESVKASIAGSGSIKIGVHGSLDADVAGSGDVYYKGTPTSIHKSVVGSGSVSAL